MPFASIHPTYTQEPNPEIFMKKKLRIGGAGK
jgi:hypothetical protein